MKKLLSFLFLVASYSLPAQTVLQNNPPSLKWLQVNTPHFRILFPRGFEEQGMRVANTFEHIRTAEAATLGSVPRKISVVLQNQSATSNGFVSLLPRRSEFYAMPSQDYNFIGTNDWLNMLMSHEYRHIVQYQHATRGFDRFLYYLSGSATLAGMAQAAAPDWFWEGDAVATETAFTHSGRGKIPNFSLLFRTNLLEGREFNYHKQYLRSYKNNIPDHYVLGYHLVSYLRERTGDPQIWGKITARSWSVPFIPFAFSNAIKKETGLYVTDLYSEMAKDYKARWQKELNALSLTPFERLPYRRTKAYTDYLYPQPMEDGSVLVMKKGIGDIEKFVLLKDGEEETVFTPGFVNDTGMLSAASGIVAWNEYGYDPRWGVRNYSLVKVYDLEHKKKNVIGPAHSRFGSAALSPDGHKVATVRTTMAYQTQLIVMDVPSGHIIKEFPNPGNHFYAMPRWSDDGKKIAVLKTTEEGKTIVIINAETGQETEALPVSYENVGYPLLYGDYLFYNSPVSGIDNIYVVRLSTHEKFQVTISRYGAYNPAVSNDSKTIYYNDQSRDGMDVVKIDFDPSAWKPYELKKDTISDYQHLVEEEGHPDLFDNVPQKIFPVTKYSRLKGMLNPYAWGINIETDLTEASLGISSKDILSTTAIDLGYVFDINERTGAYRAQLSYQGWFPIIDLSASLANREVDEGDIAYDKVVDNDTVTYVENLTFKWKEKNIIGGVRIPLMITNGKFSGNVSLSNQVGFTSVSDFSNSIDNQGRIVPSTNGFSTLFRDYIDNGKLLYNRFNLDAFRLLKRSPRDINSQWGQRIILNYYNTPYGGDFSGKQFSAYGIAYFPGILKHHSFWGYAAYQKTEIVRPDVKTKKGLDNYTFRNQIPLPRGQTISRFQEFYGFSANYTMPLWYPDIALGPLLNFQRFRGNLFFDYGLGESKTFDVSRQYSSAGAEIKIDLNLMRFRPQFDIGFRYTRGIDPSTTRYEVLIGTFNF